MARTLLPITNQITMANNVTGFDLWANCLHPDETNGNKIAHNSKRFLIVRNNHATDSTTLAPVVQLAVVEGADPLAFAAVTPVTIAAGETKIFGPWTAANFKKLADSMVELNWVHAGGTADGD